MSDIGIGLIGAGRIAQAAHLPALSRAEGAHLAGLCDPSEALARRVAARYEVPGYTDVDDLLADKAVEAVIVAVPDRLHLPLGSRAMHAGKHVLVEKPLAPTLAEAEELRALAAQTGLHLQVGAMKRHDPGVQYAALAIQDKIGRILSATVWYRVMAGLRPSTEATLFPALVVDEDVRAREATFKASRERYLLSTHGAHVMDGMRYLLGDPTALSAQMARFGGDLTWHGTANLPDGGLAHFEITPSVHAEYSEGADVYGEYGHVKLRTHFPFSLRASDVEVFEEASATSERAVFGDSNAYERQIEAFVLAIRDDLPDSPSADDGVAAVRLINAVADSAGRGGEKVVL